MKKQEEKKEEVKQQIKGRASEECVIAQKTKVKCECVLCVCM